MARKSTLGQYRGHPSIRFRAIACHLLHEVRPIIHILTPSQAAFTRSE
jgi:hypothetical protein